MVLAGVQHDAGVGQAAAHAGVAGQRVGFVVVVGVDRLHAQLRRQPRHLVDGQPVAHEQPGAVDAVRGAQRAQLGVDADQAVADELHAAVGTGQGVEDGAVEHEHAPHLPRRAQRVVQCRMVVGAQVAAQPDQRAVDRFVHGPECAAE